MKIIKQGKKHHEALRSSVVSFDVLAFSNHRDISSTPLHGSQRLPEPAVKVCHQNPEVCVVENTQFSVYWIVLMSLLWLSFFFLYIKAESRFGGGVLVGR